MKIIQVYDPPLCCSTGVCGTGIDPDLVNLSAMLKRLGQRGIVVERYNLGQQPMAFAQNALVKSLLAQDGKRALPLVLVDGAVQVKGHYPTAQERAVIVRDALGTNAEEIGPDATDATRAAPQKATL